ncbi:hypothetical protein PHMEG_00021770 [Phytophthora megakarya]|uniref:Uncharacterized protein n=1 Tax=Phytophthora megakarya TaxID=4795 RepID=A0A225VKT3_9STRA|nr:hypothetical protein PHMEG_00021770 [Phytophthora megakarya]
MEQRVVTGKSTFVIVCSAIVYLNTTPEFPQHSLGRYGHGSASDRMFVTIDSAQFVTSRAASSISTTESQVPSVSAMQGELYVWDGSFHCVPKAAFVNGYSCLAVLLRWDPPLRLLTKHYVSSSLKKVRLSELRLGLLFEQLKSRLPFVAMSNKGEVVERISGRGARLLMKH